MEGTVRAYSVRVQARDRYRHELASTGPELVKIATVAYQEGEIGVLQLLDAYRTQRQAQLRMLDILRKRGEMLERWNEHLYDRGGFTGADGKTS